MAIKKINAHLKKIFLFGLLVLVFSAGRVIQKIGKIIPWGADTAQGQCWVATPNTSASATSASATTGDGCASSSSCGNAGCTAGEGY